MAGALSKILLSSATRLENEKNELACQFHIFAILSVCLVDSAKGSVMVQNVSESSLLEEVKIKYDICPTFHQFK